MTAYRAGRLTRAVAALLVLSLAWIAVDSTFAAPRSDAPASRPAAETDRRTQRFSLRDLGAQQPLQFRGIDHSIYLPLVVRLDETVVAARLKASYTFSPSLIPELSQLKVMVSDEALGTIAAVKGKLGTPQSADVELDPRFFTEFAKLRLQFIGHYTYHCEFPFHTSLWASLSNESMLEVVTRPLVLRNDLGLLPAPFFDARDSRRLMLPFVMPAQPAMGTVRSAAVLASWFGALAGYRGAQFPVLHDRLPTQHGVVLATNDSAPLGLNLSKVDAPTLSVMPHPQHPAVKLLLVQGRDQDQLKLAVDALVLGQAALSGERVQVQSVKYPARRAAYDAPTMARVGQVVKFGELVKSPGDLQTRGASLNPIRVDLRLPADLFRWESKGLPMDLRYRNTPPRELGLGGLAILANDQLVQSLLLRPADAASRGDRLTVPFLENYQEVSRREMNIPAFHLGAANRLEFRFEIPPPNEGECRTTWLTGSQASIDPDSTVDLSGVEHYAAMPNLAFYASSGFPFTKYADLAETALILPDAPRTAEVEAALVAAGHMGASTGLAGTLLTVLPASRYKEASDKDILIVAGGDSPAPMQAWGQTLPARLESAQRGTTALHRIVDASTEWFTGAAQRKVPRDGWTQLKAQGPLGALLGFESPLSADRSVVLINGTDPSVLPATAATVLDAGTASAVQGDLALVRGDAVESFRIGTVYHVGHLTWWRWLWFQLHTHPVLLAVLALLAAVVVALLLYVALRRVAARRLEPSA